ncbi:MAG: histidinol-phosphate aminotransferase family protein [Fimbriimonas ginsengisoli]|uniref:Histidinol-phosphate aminotransferase family protein n=1 Tax=Fimbriimonas ginsengisoli TaxID=1005039 RepID=A0A931PTI2_FIMGI|nr:histidinol-phosphate aminotransferase family protein [Fimbriimonas ginsengisoli]
MGAGSSHLMFQMFPLIAPPASRVVVLDPMYGQYVHILEARLGLMVQRLELHMEQAFRIPLDRLASLARGASLLVLVNPNDPTGQVIPRDELLPLIGELGPDTLVVVDETYVDFLAEPCSLETYLNQLDNLIVLKSLSKFYILSGLRAGYAAGPPSLMRSIRQAGAPWPVSLIAHVAATEALLDEDYYKRRARKTDGLRADLAARLDLLPGLAVYPGSANFVLVEVVTPDLNASELCRRTAAHGVAIRDCGSMGRQLGERFVRIAIKSAADNERILEAVGKGLAAA